MDDRELRHEIEKLRDKVGSDSSWTWGWRVGVVVLLVLLAANGVTVDGHRYKYLRWNNQDGLVIESVGEKRP